MPVNLQPITPDTARAVLIQLKRVNLLVDRGPPGPTEFQVTQFVRGHEAVLGECERLGLTDTSLAENPIQIYRTVTTLDLDGTAVNSTWRVPEVMARGLNFFLNRDYLDPLGRLFHIRLPHLNTELTICTAWRAGLVDYLLGATYAIGGGYPFITFGWSRRIATMAYEDPASRAIFLGHEYDYQTTVERAASPLGGIEAEGWTNLDPERQRKLVIDMIEKDLRSSRNFMTTEDLGVVASDLFIRLEEEARNRRRKSWTSDELALLKFVLRRPFRDFRKPNGFSIHRGAKTVGWAQAAEKGALAESLRYKGLVDDSDYHLAPLVAQGGRGILVEGGQEFLRVGPDGDHIGVLLGRSFVDAHYTARIIAAMEEPYDPSQGGREVRIPRNPSSPLIHEGMERRLDPFQEAVAARLLRNPTEAAPYELGFHRHEYPLDYPFGQHNGVRWEVEDKEVNAVRHAVPLSDIPLGKRARVGIWSGIELGAAQVLADFLVDRQLDPHLATQFGIFAAFGFVQEVIARRTLAGRGSPMFLGGLLCMAAASTIVQTIDPSAVVHPFRNLLLGALFMALQMPVQRSLIPALSLADAHHAIPHLEAKRFGRARGVLRRVRVVAKAASLAFTTATSWVTRFLS